MAQAPESAIWAAAYSVRDRDGPVDWLRVGSLVRITSSLDGGTVSIVTESGRVFRFGQ